MNMNIYGKYVKIPDNINQDMQEKKVECTQGSLFEYLSIYSVVTLKIRSRSPKSNHFFPPS